MPLTYRSRLGDRPADSDDAYHLIRLGGYPTWTIWTKRVVELVAEVLVDVNKDNIEMSSKIVEDLGAESLDIYDMIALLEDEFGLEITDEEVEKIHTVQDVADFIREHKKAS